MNKYDIKIETSYFCDLINYILFVVFLNNF